MGEEEKNMLDYLTHTITNFWSTLDNKFFGNFCLVLKSWPKIQLLNVNLTAFQAIVCQTSQYLSLNKAKEIMIYIEKKEKNTT